MIPIKTPNLDALATKHYNAIKYHLKNRSRKEKGTGVNKYNKINDWFQKNGSRICLEDVIMAKPEKLQEIAEKYSKCKPYPDEIMYLKTLYTNCFSPSLQDGKGNKQGIGKDYYNAAALVEQLGIKVCPFCNRNFINNVDFGHRGIKRTSQMDHFYNQESYPFLAMSFYNLIPCCTVCNHIKHNNAISLSPYAARYAEDSNYLHDLLTFTFDVKSIDFLHNEACIRVKIDQHKDEIKGNIDVLKLSEHYELHSDIVLEIIKKRIMYNQTRIDELYREFKGLYRSKQELLQALYGNYLHVDDLHKRPLAKLTIDICKYLGIEL